MPRDESRRRGLGRSGRLHPIASLPGVAVLLLAAGGCVTRLAVSALGYDTAPYVGDTTTTTSTISWVTKEPSIGRVEFGAYPGDLDQVRVEAGALKIHELQLDGLVPDTRYRYRVEPSEREDASGAFWTAPSAADSFSFVVLGDTRGHEIHRSIGANRNGVDYIVTGGGGASLHAIGPPSGDTIVQYKVHHFCLIRVRADQLEVVAIDASGTRIDSLVRKATPASYDHAGIGE